MSLSGEDSYPARTLVLRDCLCNATDVKEAWVNLATSSSSATESQGKKERQTELEIGIYITVCCISVIYKFIFLCLEGHIQKAGI